MLLLMKDTVTIRLSFVVAVFVPRKLSACSWLF